jgi:hypothetical protein
MSATDTTTVERRLGRIRSILTALSCVAAKADEGICIGVVCEELELMAQVEMSKVIGVLGTEVLDRDC